MWEWGVQPPRLRQGLTQSDAIPCVVMKTPARAKEITLLALYHPVVVTVLLDPAWSLDTSLTLIKNNFVA